MRSGGSPGSPRMVLATCGGALALKVVRLIEGAGDPGF